MIGTLVGIGLAISYLSAVFGSTTEESNLFSGSLLAGLATIAIFTVVGLTLFPRTIGIAFTFPLIVSPIAIIGGFVKHGIYSGLTMLIFAMALWGSSQLIARMRPEAT
jgi:uncharacterized membrane protein